MNNSVSQESLVAQFKTHFDATPDGIATAPGRVNLIGEHTDYNDGFVLPCALEFNTRIVFKRRNDSIINVRSLSYEGQIESFDLSKTIDTSELQWGNYIRAVVFVLVRDGHALSGFDMLIDSNVPQGSGLSSSAALEVALGGLFNHADCLGLTNAQIAVYGQKAENDFIDCQCGIMDQLISASGEKDHALLLDCRSLDTKSVVIPADLVVVIVNSNYPRKLVDSEYNARRIDCEKAAQKLNVPMLRDATLDMLRAAKASLSANEYKRAHHIITENQRVLHAVEALTNNDIESLSTLMSESHKSMQYDFEITVPAIDGLVNICANALQNRGGARMTGGGFGGAVVCVCRSQDIQVLVDAVEANYQAQFNLKADIYVCHAGDGLTVSNL